MYMKPISLILACTFEGGIGYENNIPWNIKSDIIKFKNITLNTDDNSKQNAIIMGKNTYESLPFKKLKNRINIVLSKNNRSKYLENDNIITYENINEALYYCNNNENIEKIYIIGGGYIYNIFLNDYLNNIDNIYLSIIKEKYTCNTFVTIKKIFEKFYFIKDKNYNEENDKYISYICKKKLITK